LPISVHNCSIFAGEGDQMTGASATSLASGGWGTANLAVYIPFSIPWPFPVRRVFWGNGSAPNAGTNCDVGLYSIGGTRIWSAGSTAQDTARNTVPQYVTPSSDILLVPGRYYFGFVCSVTTANRLIVYTFPAALQARFRGYMQEALGSTVLPAAMTPAQFSGTIGPFVGISRAASGF
jgi:hypothetical protein